MHHCLAKTTSKASYLGVSRVFYTFTYYSIIISLESALGYISVIAESSTINIAISGIKTNGFWLNKSGKKRNFVNLLYYKKIRFIII